jgi:hypothetical protein
MAVGPLATTRRKTRLGLLAELDRLNPKQFPRLRIVFLHVGDERLRRTSPSEFRALPGEWQIHALLTP